MDYDKILRMIRDVILGFLTFAIASVAGFPTAVNPITATQYESSFDRNRILIGGYNFDLNYADAEHVGYVKDAYIDFLVSGANDAFLDLCYENGVGVIAKNYGGLPAFYYRQSDIEPWLNITAESFRDHPALWGNDLIDEPVADVFPQLGEAVGAYNGAAPGKVPYINLFPAYANSEQLGTEPDWYCFSDTSKSLNRYAKHVNKYIETIDTDYISVDIYPLGLKEDGGVPYKTTGDTWLGNLDILAKACRDTERDLWVIIQSTGMVKDSGSGPRFADETDIRYQTYVSLSFGAKAIIHACYHGGWWDSASHLINPQGERTQTYYDAQTVNAEIRLLSPVYMEYVNTGAYVHNKYLQEYTIAELTPVKFGTIKSVDCPHTLLIGCFEKTAGEGSAFTLVNMTEIGDNKAVSPKLALENAGTVTVYRNGLPTVILPDASGAYTVDLASGEGVFVTVEP